MGISAIRVNRVDAPMCKNRTTAWRKSQHKIFGYRQKIYARQLNADCCARFSVVTHATPALVQTKPVPTVFICLVRGRQAECLYIHRLPPPYIKHSLQVANAPLTPTKRHTLLVYFQACGLKITCSDPASLRQNPLGFLTVCATYGGEICHTMCVPFFKSDISKIQCKGK